MKQGLDHLELIEKVKGDLPLKEDYIVDSRNIDFRIDDGKTMIDLDGIEFRGSEHMNGQIANKLQIPKKYFDRMITDAPQLAETNVDHWLQNEHKPYMVRTLGDTARAFLSDRYSIIDNWDVLGACLPALKPFIEQDDIKFEQSHITDNKMYLRLTVPSKSFDVNPEKGDVVHFGLQISNSEIGLGQVEVSPFLKRLVCTNGMTATE